MPANDIPRVDRQHAEDAISELQAWAAHDRYRRVTCEIAVGAILAALQSPPPREAAIREPWGHPDLIEGLGAAAANLRTYEWGHDLAEHCDTAAFLLTEGPPSGEADAALWTLVEEWTVAHREWMAPHGHSLDGPEYRRYDEARTALLAYRPPSAPAPAVTPTAKPRVESCERCQMKLPEHLGTYAIGVRGGTAWRCAACQPIEGPSGRLLREEVVNRRKRHLAALASPPPPETQP